MKKDEKKEQQNNDEQLLKGVGATIVLILLLIVIVISAITYAVETHFGRAAGTAVLTVIAVFLAAYLYRKEIGNFFRGKK